MFMNKPENNHHKLIQLKQTGAVLVTALVLMSILAIVAVATMRSSSMDVTIHKNMKNRSNAFQGAEAAVRAGELWLENEVAGIIPEAMETKPDLSQNQVWSYTASEIQDIFSKDENWWSINGESYGPDMTNADYQVGTSLEPRFIIERMGTVDDGSGVLDISERVKNGIDYFRVTGYSVGTESNAAVLLQTTFALRFR